MAFLTQPPPSEIMPPSPEGERYIPVPLTPEQQQLASGTFGAALWSSIKQRLKEAGAFVAELVSGESPALEASVREGRAALAQALTPRSWMEQQIIGGLTSAASFPLSAAGMLAGGRLGGFASGLTLAGGSAYWDRRLQQQSRAKAISDALVQGSIEGAGDLFALVPLFRRSATVAQRGLQFVLRSLASEVGEEHAQALSEKLHDVDWSRSDWREQITRNLGEWLKEVPERTRDTVVQTLVAAGVSGPTTAALVPANDEFIARGKQQATDILDYVTANGGVTWDLKRGRTISRGFAVGAHPDRTEVITDRPLQAADIQAFIERNQDLLRQPNKYVSIWNDPESGATYLDVSTVLDRRRALKLAEKLGEKAIYDLQAKSEIWLDRVSAARARDQDSERFLRSELFRARLRELAQEAAETSDGRPWWQTADTEIEQTFGYNTKLFNAIVAATSPGNTVLRNLKIATHFYRQLMQGVPFSLPPGQGHPYFQSAWLPNLERIRRGEPLSGQKVQEMERALNGVTEAAIFDTWWQRVIGRGKNFKFTPPRRAALQAVIKEEAEKLGLSPSEFSARVWVAAIRRAKTQGDLFGQPFKATEKSQEAPIAAQFRQLLKQVADARGVSVSELMERLRQGDTSLIEPPSDIFSVRGVPPSVDLEAGARELAEKLKALQGRPTPTPQQGALTLPQGADVGPSAKLFEKLGRAKYLSEALFVGPDGSGLAPDPWHGRGGGARPEHTLALENALREVDPEMYQRIQREGIAPALKQYQLVRVQRNVAEFSAPPTGPQIKALAERLAGNMEAIIAYSPPGRPVRTTRLSLPTAESLRNAIQQLLKLDQDAAQWASIEPPQFISDQARAAHRWSEGAEIITRLGVSRIPIRDTLDPDFQRQFGHKFIVDTSDYAREKASLNALLGLVGASEASSWIFTDHEDARLAMQIVQDALDTGVPAALMLKVQQFKVASPSLGIAAWNYVQHWIGISAEVLQSLRDYPGVRRSEENIRRSIIHELGHVLDTVGDRGDFRTRRSPLFALPDEAILVERVPLDLYTRVLRESPGATPPRVRIDTRKVGPIMAEAIDRFLRFIDLSDAEWATMTMIYSRGKSTYTQEQLNHAQKLLQRIFHDPIAATLAYPLLDLFLLKSKAEAEYIQREVFAQLWMLYHAYPDLVRVELPLTYQWLDEMTEKLRRAKTARAVELIATKYFLHWKPTPKSEERLQKGQMLLPGIDPMIVGAPPVETPRNSRDVLY